MSDPVVNISRTVVRVNGEVYQPARFVYHNNVAAVWLEDKRTRTATRVLYATDATFVPNNSARDPLKIITTDDTWEIRQQSGGCSCGSPLKKLTFQQLLDPELTSV